MPTYQYACTACGHQLEVVQSFTDSSLTVCPECEGSLRKLFSGVGVVFKGSGFYRTDSRASAKPAASASSSSNTTSASSGSSTSSSGGGAGTSTSGSSASSSGSSASSSGSSASSSGSSASSS